MGPGRAISSHRAEAGASSDSRAYDLLMGSPLILFSVFALAGFAIVIPQQWRGGSGNYPIILTEAVNAVFLGLQLVLVCTRRLPIAKAGGFRPRVWAFAGANFGYALLLLPRVTLGAAMAGLSSLIVVTGTLGSVVALMWLGKGFSIFPQARILVTGGPYTFVRHPLYLFEQWAMLGVALQYRQPWALLLVAVSLCLQFPRMHYEEEVLAETFAGYRDYKCITPRLIPRFPLRKQSSSPE